MAAGISMIPVTPGLGRADLQSERELQPVLSIRMAELKLRAG
jgi:hypothetical protein